MHGLFITEIYRSGAVFVSADSTGRSSFTFTQRAPEKAMFANVVRNGHSRSLKLVPIESPYATSY